MKAVSVTHQGCVRPTNQDALLEYPGKHGLFGVADGMGGHNAGDVASRMASLLMGRVLEGLAPTENALINGIELVNKMIFDEQRRDTSLSGMGTTLTVLWEDADRILLGHVGDSRAYLIREGKIVQVTQDHSMVGEMLRDGLITEEEAQRHPYRNVITRALGAADTVQADVLILDKKPGDVYLICSDGLYEYVSPDLILDTILCRSMQDAADDLLQRALEGGGRDNISLVIAEVTA